MNQLELLNRILYLIPDAKCSVWKCKIHEFQGEGDPIPRGDFLIAWNSTNTKSCPSWEELISINDNEINDYIEKKRKQERNISFSKNLEIISSYKNQCLNNPNLTFSDYLDDLEKLQSSLRF